MSSGIFSYFSLFFDLPLFSLKVCPGWRGGCASQDPAGSVGFLRLWGELCVAQSPLLAL